MSGKISSVIDMIVQTSMKGTSSVISGLKSIDTAIKTTSSSTVAAANAALKASNRLTHNTGKNFAAMHGQMSPVLAKFAEMAAAIYVVGFAYDKINLVAKFTQTKEAFGILSDTFNFNAELMVNKLKDLSNGTITAFEAMRSASVSAASGLSTKQMEELAIAAKNTSRAMGIDMSDAYQRITRGVTKLEPELLDELGLITRLQGVLLAYSREMGISADKVSSATKIQIFHKAVVEEATAKYASLGKMQKSTAEEIETMKNGLADATLLFSESLLPALLSITNAFKDNAGALAILGVLYATHKTQIGLAAAAQTYHTAQEIKASAAAKSLIVSTISSAKSLKVHTGSLIRNTSALRANTLADQLAAKSKMSLSKVSSISAISDTVKGAMGKISTVGAAAFSMLTGPIGLVATGIALVANETGILDGLWEKLSGRAADLGSQLKKLNEQQVIAYDLLVKDGEEKWSALKQAKLMGAALEQDLGNGLTVTTALLANATGNVRLLSQAMVQGADGTQIFLDSQKEVNVHLNTAKKELDSQNAVLNKLKANIDDASNSWFNSAQKTEIAKKAYEEQKKKVDALTKAIVNQANTLGHLSNKGIEVAKVTKEHDRSTAQLGATVNLTVEKLKKLGLTKQDRLTNQINDVTAQIKALGNATITAKAKLSKISDVKTDSAIAEVKKLQEQLKTYAAQTDEATKAVSRLSAKQTSTNRVKALTGELALLKQLNAERMAAANSNFEKSDKSASDIKTKYKVILDSEKEYTSASKALMLEKLNAGLISFAQYQLNIKTLASKSRTTLLQIEDQKTKDLKAQNEKRIRDSGSMWENIDLYIKNSKKNIGGWGNALATTFKSVGGIISGTLTSELGKAFGFIEDRAKTTFDNSLAAARTSYAGMVKAANDAFGIAQRDQGTSNNRALQDIETKRIRDIADLTKQRNSGSIGQAQFDQGVTNIDTGVRRAKEDLGVSNDRAAQDAQQTRQDSLLTAQEDLNKAMLEADKQYAADKKSVWDNMYANIKQTVFSSLTEIAVQKAAIWAWEAAGDVISANTKIATKSAEASGETAIDTAKSEVKQGIAIADTTASYASIPFVGLALAAAVIMAIKASTPSSPTIPKPPTIPAPKTAPAAKFHTGGLITGTSQEIPITAYKGEGVLNTYNGMKAIGGQAGLNKANATGSLDNNQESKGNTTLILEFKDDSGKTNKTITLDNLEDLLRGAAGKTMRKVVNDGVNLGYS